MSSDSGTPILSLRARRLGGSSLIWKANFSQCRSTHVVPPVFTRSLLAVVSK